MKFFTQRTPQRSSTDRLSEVGLFCCLKQRAHPESGGRPDGHALHSWVCENLRGDDLVYDVVAHVLVPQIVPENKLQSGEGRDELDDVEAAVGRASFLID